MKKLFLFVSILTLCFGTYAQVESPVVFSLTGKARFKTPDAEKAVRLRTGDQLAANGRIIIKEPAEVGLMFDEQFIYLKEPGRYKLEDLMAPGKMEESEAAELFTLKLEPALDPYFGTVKLQRAGFASTASGTTRSTSSTTRSGGTLPPKKKTRTGHGNKENALIRLMPIGGKVVGPNVKFAWAFQDSALKSNKNFNLVVMDANDMVLLKQAVKGRRAGVDFSKLNLEPGSNFKWRVELADDASKNTGDISVQFAPTTAATAALDLLQEDPAYQMASPAAKLLMEAVAYENAGLLAKANATYRTVRKDFKKDRLGRLMYFAFLWDNDLVE